MKSTSREKYRGRGEIPLYSSSAIDSPKVCNAVAEATKTKDVNARRRSGEGGDGEFVGAEAGGASPGRTMGEDESADTWSAWFLDAIRKIRSQKQRPSVERICHAIRQHHNYHEEEIAEHLEVAVKRGDVLKIFNKGQSSYKDPCGLQARPLKVARTADLSKVFGKAVRELGERDGSTIKNIEKYVRQSHTVEEEAEGDLRSALKLSAKRAVERGYVIQEGRLFRQPDRPPNLKGKFNDPGAFLEPPVPKVRTGNFVSFLFYSILPVRSSGSVRMLLFI